MSLFNYELKQTGNVTPNFTYMTKLNSVFLRICGKKINEVY